MKSNASRRATFLLACFCLAFILAAFVPSAYAGGAWIKTYDTGGNLTKIFNLGDTVRIIAYSDTTPYYITVRNPNGVVIFTETSNTTNYSRDLTGITTKLGFWNITLGSMETTYVSDMFIIYASYRESVDFSYVGRDLNTQGNWIDSQYGDYGYALPYAEVKEKEMAIGETTGMKEPTHEFWWREPWSMRGEKYYSYEDYLGGNYILEYDVMGPEGPPRALIDVDSMYYRPSWYCHESSITVTLNGIAGNYSVSIYFLDWDAPTLGRRRTLNVSVTSDGARHTVTLGATSLDNFATGTYAIFEVNSDGIIEIEVVTLTWRNAVIAGIFLDEISSSVGGVNFLRVDRVTRGNWRSSYGNDYYLLPGFDIPSNGVTHKPIDKAYDETNIPSENYEVSEGVYQYAADAARTYGEYPHVGQYAAYAWTVPLDRTASDPRVLAYPEDKIYYGYSPTPSVRIYGQWDSGELGWPLDYFTIKLKIPEGDYLLSTYAMDFARLGRSETIEIWDESMANLLDSQYISSAEINEGIYVQWIVRGPRTIYIKIIADPGNLNSFIEGVFLNCLDYSAVWRLQVILEVPLGILGVTIALFAALTIRNNDFKLF